MNKLLLIGNFVNDIILIHEDLVLQRERSFTDFLRDSQLNGRDNKPGRVTKNTALGGSVTYASLASSAFGGATSYIVSTLGTDINDSYKTMIEPKTHPTTGTINTDYIKKTDSNNTSYQLNYYNRKKNRTLLLMERGQSIGIEQCLRCLCEQQPDAISFVPIAGEIDVDLIVAVLEYIARMPTADAKPKIVAFDIQGLLRAFNEQRVTTHSREVMVERLTRIGYALKSAGVISILKAEYGEAVAIVCNDNGADTHNSSTCTATTMSTPPITPGECAYLLRSQFHFTLVSVTMGGDGGFISSGVTGEQYIPTFKPVAVMDETGCGDTFLSCTILELLHTLSGKSMIDESAIDPLDRYQLASEDIIHCLEVGSAGASFLVEQIGPNGFASRSTILDRVNNGQKQSKSIYLQQQHQHQHQHSPSLVSKDQEHQNQNNSSSSSSSTAMAGASATSSNTNKSSVEKTTTTTNETTITKPPKSTTHYS
ncbi:hypothetical protein PPL_00466 [Heterostelium album PN500]|uniref:Carbohydrate kinase PfkB domain-containing protein n=1 Tax=Heterostelium pallidum (strain ATCC 26659 / Pp 5 / PN500) TaxID=670386 RepID=D3AWJ1_HETP5|nr:hypothetical protein PPL_00466 [Heterostelium album PN500]EFA86664.1 hypothetical protein PPL_00466 [Heterostelium album PN500]|eukprot:XP_020438768.1 hypothetical protein PPL_00466 [Heterostelium album PN500]